MRASLLDKTLTFQTPIPTSYGLLESRDLLQLSIEGTEGSCGYGEAAPLEPYDGVSIQATREALDAALSDPSVDIALPQAAAALDLAALDLAGKERELSVAALLSESPLEEVAVNASLVASDATSLASEATAAVEAGFETLKLKAGFSDDLERVRAVRESVGSSVKIRIDANGAWNVSEAIHRLEQLAEFELEFCEEPCRGVQALSEIVESSPVPLAIDESGVDTDAIVASGCQIACLKISRLGGITGTLETAERCLEAGIAVFLASMYDGPLGIAAGLHAAAAIKPALACGLDTLGLFELPNPLPSRGGAIAVPTSPGLGVSPLE